MFTPVNFPNIVDQGDDGSDGSDNYNGSDNDLSDDNFGQPRVKSLWEKRKIMMISEIDSLVPDEINDHISLIDEIIDVSDKSASSVCRRIKTSHEPADFIYNVIEFALNIRPLSANQLISLLNSLSLNQNNAKIKSILAKQDTIYKEGMFLAIKDTNSGVSHVNIIDSVINDDLDSFSDAISKSDFESQLHIRVGRNSPIRLVQKGANRDTFSLLQVTAFYGAAKCFKNAILSNTFELNDVAAFAIAGGNTEIVHILEQRNISFANCLEIAIRYHRNDLSEWIIIHNKCNESSLMGSCSSYNYKVLIFSLMNEFRIDDALMKATEQCDLKIVKYLIDEFHYDVEELSAYDALNKADDNSRNIPGFRGNMFPFMMQAPEPSMKLVTPLYVASEKCCLEIIKYFIEECHADIKYISENALSLSVEKGNLGVLKYLVETCHINTETKDGDGKTPLFVATEKGYFDVFKYLIESCSANIETKDKSGRNLLYVASEQGCLDIIKYIIEERHVSEKYISSNALVCATLNGNIELVKYLVEVCHANVETKDRNERIPLICAAEKNNFELIKYFVDVCHANVESKDKIGRTALFVAAEQSNFEIIKYLTSQGHANVEVKSKFNSTESGSSNGSFKSVKETTEMKVTPLFIATEKGDLDIIKYLIDVCHADTKYVSGNALTLAAERGDLDVIKYLNEACHANVETKDKSGRTPLTYAVEKEYFDIVKYLVESCHADVETKGKYRDEFGNDVAVTPLYIATEKSYFDIIKYLVESCHADISTKDRNGRTPLFIAIEKKYKEILKYFIETCHVDVETRSKYKDELKNEKEMTPLTCATQKGYIDIVDYLVNSCHANVEAKGSYKIIKISGPNRSIREVIDKEASSLAIATEAEDIKLIEYLIEEGHADVETKDNLGRTPLMIAVDNCNYNIVKYLLETAHANVEAKDNNERTPLTIALENSDAEMAKQLIEVGHANVQEKGRFKDDDGNTKITFPLLIASEKGNLELVKLLIELGHADVEIKGKYGIWNDATSLFIASERGDLEIVNYLIETCHANVESKAKCKLVENISGGRRIVDAMKGANEKEVTPIYVAAMKNHLLVMKSLVSLGKADIETKDKNGRTPLFIAVMNGRLQIVKYLIKEAHANPEVKDKNGKTPYMVAAERGDSLMIQYLADVCHIEVKETIKEANKKTTKEKAPKTTDKGNAEILKFMAEMKSKNAANGESRAGPSKGNSSPYYQSQFGGRTIGMNPSNPNPNPRPFGGGRTIGMNPSNPNRFGGRTIGGNPPNQGQFPGPFGGRTIGVNPSNPNSNQYRGRTIEINPSNPGPYGGRTIGMNPPNANQYINSMYGLDQSNTGARRGRTIGERTDQKPQNRENEDNGETSEEDDNDMMF